VGGDTWAAWTGPWMVGHWTSTAPEGPWDPDPANPVLGPGAYDEWDSFSIVEFAVWFDGSTFHMWYGASASPPQPWQTNTGYATNDDGYGDWDKYAHNPLEGLEPGDPGAWDEAITPTTVLVDGPSYRMWFTGAQLEEEWHIGYAESQDGLTWDNRLLEPVLRGAEGDRLFTPKVMHNAAGLSMWYIDWPSDAGFNAPCYAISPDGVHWGTWPDNPVLLPTLPCNAADSMAVLREGGTIHGWVSFCGDVYHVSSPFDVVFFDGFETGDTSVWGRVVGDPQTCAP